MSVSSGTANLFANVAVAIALASGCAWALRNPAEFYAIAQPMLPAHWVAPSANVDPEKSDERETARAPAAMSYADVTLRSGHNGHFEAEAEINGRSVYVMVDTGATMVALTYEDAERAGIYLRPSDFTQQASTANGVARIAPIMIDSIAIGSITVRNVRGAVCERGKLQQTLLGMSFLGRLSRVEMRANTLELHE